MKENSLYDKKSLRTVVGKTADFAELAKDCVAFSNAQGGVIDIGIENDDMLPPANQRVSEELPIAVVNLHLETKLNMRRCRGCRRR